MQLTNDIIARFYDDLHTLTHSSSPDTQIKSAICITYIERAQYVQTFIRTVENPLISLEILFLEPIVTGNTLFRATNLNITNPEVPLPSQTPFVAGEPVPVINSPEIVKTAGPVEAENNTNPQAEVTEHIIPPAESLPKTTLQSLMELVKQERPSMGLMLSGVSLTEDDTVAVLATSNGFYLEQLKDKTVTQFLKDALHTINPNITDVRIVKDAKEKTKSDIVDDIVNVFGGKVFNE